MVSLKKCICLMLFVVILASCFSVAAETSITLPNLVSDNMVIQCDKPIKLWGYGGDAGKTVNVAVKNSEGIIVNSGSCVIKGNGWNIELQAMKSGGPYILEFTYGQTTILVKNVLVGELWLQSGQSNMVLPISGCQKGTEDDIFPNPESDQIRLFYNVESKYENSTDNASDLKGQWIIADAQTAKNYSAVGYVALEQIHHELNVPVGGICNAVGGAGIDSFIGDAPSLGVEKSGSYFKNKVAPITNMNIRGVMWYQGEGNRNEGISTYENKVNNLIGSYRYYWNDENLPFLIVQLPASPMKYYASWLKTFIIEDFSGVRIAQSNAYVTQNNVGLVVTVDCKPKYESLGEDSLHPWAKKNVGLRLGNFALGMVYNKLNEYKSPVFSNIEKAEHAITVTFVDVYGGLKTTDGKSPRCFMIAGEDKVYYDAEAEIVGENQIRLTSDKVKAPAYVSYSREKIMYPYENPSDGTNSVQNTYPDVNVVNSENLPLSPFDSDVSIGKKAEIEQPKLDSRSVRSKNAVNLFILATLLQLNLVIK